MVEPDSTDADQPGWCRLALSVVLAVTLIRILVVYSTPIPLFFDEAQYWSWAQELAFGYHSKPPFIAWVIAATTFVCGDAAGCVRLGAPLTHGATAFVLFFIGCHVFDARIGFWTTLTYAVLPGPAFPLSSFRPTFFSCFFGHSLC